MQVEFLLGPAGSGKTFRCLERAREELTRSPGGLPLLFIAPKQATYQLERQLLASGALNGYTRLRILSFERLARLIYELTGKPEPKLLDEEGRVMVLRALLTRHQSQLKLFRGSARTPGFAQELSRLIRELQQSRFSPALIWKLANKSGNKNRLEDKLSDLTLLAGEYAKWLKAEQLQDSDRLVELATDLLEGSPALRFEQLWLDGFARLNAQERRLLKTVAPRCSRMTLAFCLECERTTAAWHSHWSTVNQTFAKLKAEFESIGAVQVIVSRIDRTTSGSATWADHSSRAGQRAEPFPTRFSSEPELQHLEGSWADAKPYSGPGSETPLRAVRLVECPDLESEATFAAREILRFVRHGGRFRETAVLVRQLDRYHDVLRRIFLRFDIPFFLDRRESIAHHPVAELTRGALRTLAFDWRQPDWFRTLKSGLVPATENEIDRLENESLARGWEGAAWQNPITIQNDPALAKSYEQMRSRLIKPFVQLCKALGNHPTGAQLSKGLQSLWSELGVQDQLESWSAASDEAGPVHRAVWEQLQQWVQTIAVAFRAEARSLIEWIPILETGLEGVSIGVVPPVLDQVLLGAVDRSRNPDLRAVFVLGLNHGVFPANVTPPAILAELDRELLEQYGVEIGINSRAQIAQERFFGYIACTRARERLVVTYALRDTNGAALTPSSFVGQLQSLFPQLKEPEKFETVDGWEKAEHYCEAVAPLLRARRLLSNERTAGHGEDIRVLSELPQLAGTLRQLEQTDSGSCELSPDLAQALYGRVHETSVSALEKFGSCPFSFFIDSGLRAQERKRFELDARQQGLFQHQVLERFHLHLKEQGKTWHNVTVAEARAEVGRIADELLPTYEEGMLIATEQNRFLALHHKERLQQLIELLVGWMKQYQFEPAMAELKFGFTGSPLPSWRIDAGNGHALALRGSIDRVDLYRPDGRDEVLCVVMDYKSSGRKIDEIYMKHGIQLQLPGYLAALRRCEGAAALFGAGAIRPAGIFFVNLRGEYASAANRDEVLADKSAAHARAFRHIGRYDAATLPYLDNRNVSEGDQIPYKRKLNGQPGQQVKGPEPTGVFGELLDQTEAQMEQFGREIYAGKISVDPYKRGTTTPCEQCEHSAICRIDPWVHEFRRLNTEAAEEEE